MRAQLDATWFTDRLNALIRAGYRRDSRGCVRIRRAILKSMGIDAEPIRPADLKLKAGRPLAVEPEEGTRSAWVVELYDAGAKTVREIADELELRHTKGLYRILRRWRPDWAAEMRRRREGG